MKITVITPRFAIAGVPLAQLRFAKALARRGHDVSLVIGYYDSEFESPKSGIVGVEIWDTPTVRAMFRPLCKHFLDMRPDIVFSAEDHLNTVVLLAAILTRSKAIVSGSSRVNPYDTYSSRPFTKRWLLRQLMQMVMWRADALTCVSEDMVLQYRTVFHAAPHVCVYNIVADAESNELMQEAAIQRWCLDQSTPLLVAAGRLAPWKGFADLVDAVAILTKRRKVHLLILGDGPLRAELEKRIEEHRLRESIELLGYVPNPLKYFARADVFVLSSLVEGLPNVLVEAMFCGCTPVATDCPTGPREVLLDGKYGYLVPMNDPAAMADAIDYALDNPIPDDLLREAVAPFSEQRVIDRHFELLGVNTP